MSKFGSSNTSQQSTEQQAAATTQQQKQEDPTKGQETTKPLETDVQKAAVMPPPTTNTLSVASASDLIEQREQQEAGQSATQEDVVKAHQQLAEALQAQANKVRQGIPEQSLVQGNVVAGAITTQNSALALLNKLGSGTAEAQGGVRPRGYYTVHTSSVPSKKGRIKAQSIAGLFYFDPADLDEVSTKALDAFVEAGMATFEGERNDSQPTAE